jgi:hypothetical protein
LQCQHDQKQDEEKEIQSFICQKADPMDHGGIVYHDERLVIPYL